MKLTIDELIEEVVGAALRRDGQTYRLASACKRYREALRYIEQMESVVEMQSIARATLAETGGLPMTIPPDELAHAQKLCDEATPPPWSYSDDIWHFPFTMPDVGKSEDYRVLAYARNNLPRFIAAVRELQKRVQKLEDAKYARDDLLCRCKSLLRDDGDPYGDDDDTLVRDIDAALDGKV